VLDALAALRRRGRVPPPRLRFVVVRVAMDYGACTYEREKHKFGGVKRGKVGGRRAQLGSQRSSPRRCLTQGGVAPEKFSG